MEKVQIGDATLYLGDCMDILPTLDKVDAVITDPPYKVAAAGGGIGAKRQYLSDIDGHIDEGFNVSLLEKYNNWLVFCGKPQIIELAQKAEHQSLRWQLRTWNKTNPTPLTNGNYLPDTEYMIHAFKKHIWQGKKRWIVGNVEKNDFDHPTVKPIYVMNDSIICASNVGDIILDPFMGSGTTGVAAIQMGRKFIGIEREPKYFEIACKRIEQASKQVDMFVEQTKQEQVSLL